MFSDYRLRILGVPMGLGGMRKGANLGPDALRLAGIAESLSPLVKEVYDGGDVEAVSTTPTTRRGEGLGFFEAVLANLVEVKSAVSKAFGPKSLPIVLGGDHSIELGTIPAALEYDEDKPLGILWIDAHADYNTPDTSPTGNLHGMALAGVCGLPCGVCVEPMRAQWQRLLQTLAHSGRFLGSERIVWFGLRDVDPGEGERITRLNSAQAITMHEIDKYGIRHMIEHAINIFQKSGVKRLWISFDADVIDPAIAPGTGTHVRGGLTYREAHLVAEMLHELFARPDCFLQLAGIKIAEVNPILDYQNSTAAMCVEWVGSLLGKRVLPGWPNCGQAED